MPNYYRKIPGWGRIDEYYRIIAESVPTNATLVEIGVWQGRSAVFMAELLKELNKPVKFYLVDSFNGGKILGSKVAMLGLPLLDILRANIAAAGVSEQVTGIMAKSSVAAAAEFDDESVDFAFVDADHDYTSVAADIRAWWPKIKIRGILAGHDYVSGWVGVAKAVDEHVAKHRLKLQLIGEAWQIRKEL